MELNNLSSTTIHIGTELLIPGGGSSASPPAATTPTSGVAPATPTRRPPTASPTSPRFAYAYRESSMYTVETHCDYVRMEGWVYKADGSAADGVTVQLQWSGGTEYKQTGDPLEESGFWKFTPLPRDTSMHVPTTFTLRIVRSESDPTPLSRDFSIDYQDCVIGPELFLNIIFEEL